jgi:hypothetical protein
MTRIVLHVLKKLKCQGRTRGPPGAHLGDTIAMGRGLKFGGGEGRVSKSVFDEESCGF